MSVEILGAMAPIHSECFSFCRLQNRQLYLYTAFCEKKQPKVAVCTVQCACSMFAILSNLVLLFGFRIGRISALPLQIFSSYQIDLSLWNFHAFLIIISQLHQRSLMCFAALSHLVLYLVIYLSDHSALSARIFICLHCTICSYIYRVGNGIHHF